MENQHRQIKGYRDLSPEDVALMNEIKEVGASVDALIERVGQRINEQYQATSTSYEEVGSGDPFVNEARVVDTPEQALAKQAERERLEAAQPGRWTSIAKTELQQGFMALVRAVAQPGRGR